MNECTRTHTWNFFSTSEDTVCDYRKYDTANSTNWNAVDDRQYEKEREPKFTRISHNRVTRQHNSFKCRATQILHTSTRQWQKSTQRAGHVTTPPWFTRLPSV